MPHSMDEKTFQLILKYLPDMKRFAQYRTRQFPHAIFDADDVVQESILNMLREGVFLDKERSPKNYLLTRIRLTHQKMLYRIKGRMHESITDKNVNIILEK